MSTSTLETISIVRDVLFLSLLLLGSLAGFAVYRKLGGVLKSVNRAKSSMEEMASAVSDGFVKPTAGAGLGFGTWKTARWLMRRREKRRDADEE